MIFVTANNTILSSDNIPAPYHNLHNIIDVILDSSTPCCNNESFTYRQFNKISSEALNSLLAGCDWTPFDSTIPDLVTLLQCLTENLTATLNVLAPEKTVTPRKRQPPLIGTDTVLLRRKRDDDT